MSERPVIRHFTLPNGDKIMSLRESTHRAGLKAAAKALGPAAQKIADGLNEALEWVRNASTRRPGLGQDGTDSPAATSGRGEP